ncbi:Esterase FE4 [Eumeta japonica]|uniref:Carboxylic ester hydrolase n=1 Tax=Eumeta variegata TaxID=151549 RepID=A0A4C1YCN9_EUMVA|nr:Esterase FE4 [Eumeta japonica]
MSPTSTSGSAATDNYGCLTGPLPPPTWLEIFEAVDKKVICPQHPYLFQMFPSALEYKMEENCLTANVFAPDTKETDLSVVVYIHGGAFQIGMGHMFVHDSLLNSGKIIVVNFNYRLGPHGFLCLGTEDAPGNAGMKDQVAALRWVKRNIAAFGGNPDDVTVAGYSAGATSVELLLASPSTRGLFNKMILESGSGVAVWAVQRDPLETAKTYAQSLGFDSDGDIQDLEDFFTHLPIDTLQSEYSFTEMRDSTFYFAPCVEREEAKDPFLVDDPANIFKNGEYDKLPMLTGFADMEGILRLSSFEQWKDDMNANFHDFLPADLRFADDDERRKVAQEIKEFYFGDSPINTDTVVGYVNYFSDVMFVYPTYRSVSLQAAAGSENLYLYVYAFVNNRTSTSYPHVTGARHCSHMKVLGYNIFFIYRDTETHNLKKMKQLLPDVWKNFIITGNYSTRYGFTVRQVIPDAQINLRKMSLREAAALIYALRSSNGSRISFEGKNLPGLQSWGKPTPEGSYAAKVLGEWLPTSPARPRHALFNASSELRAALWPGRMALWDRVYSEHYRAPVPPPSSRKTSDF